MTEFIVRKRMVTIYKYTEEIEAKDAEEAIDMTEEIENQLITNGSYTHGQLLGTTSAKVISAEPVEY